MNIFERLMAALKRYRLRDETGAGGLLPIITVGMMVVIIAASVAASTAFAAKISGQQVTQVKVDMEVKSMLAVATAELSSTVTPEPVITVTGSGRYSLYWSASDTAPATDTSPGVKALVKGNQVPVETKWIVMRMRPLSQNTDVKFAVFRYYPQKSQVLDNAIRWNGGVNFINSEISLGTGSSGIHSLALQNTGTTGGLLVQNSTISGDIYADLPAQVEVYGGTVHGSIFSKGSVSLGTKPVILGDLRSGSTISGIGDVAGTQQANQAIDLSPTLPLQSYNLTLSSAPAYIMKAEDCSTPDRLKSKIESYTSPIVLQGVGICPSTSWNVEVKPKTNIMLYHGASITVDGFKVTNSQGTVGFASGGTLTLKNTVYSVGAVGYFVSRGALLISNSDLTGGISGYGTAPGSLLDISNSKFSYSPVTAPLLNFTSASPHIVRVS